MKQITAAWPGARLVHLWNRIPGVAPIKKVTDRQTALKRIWAAVQAIEPMCPPQVDIPSAPQKAGEARHGTKKAALLGLLQRPQGASVREIMAALGWQSHSVRGCLSTLSRKGVTIHSFRRPDGDRAYSIEDATEPNPEGVQ